MVEEGLVEVAGPDVRMVDLGMTDLEGDESVMP
jgi:hypothetical protein